MEQGALFHESIYEALRATVAALGGAKQTASQLWPEKPTDEANRLLLDCLNPDRAARLDPEKLLLLLKLARGRGVHNGIAWILSDLGYGPPIPVEPEDQRAELQREAIATVQKLDQIVTRLERVGASPIRAVK
jgi:hypothetical protein